MKINFLGVAITTCFCSALPVMAGEATPSASQIFDKQLSATESEVMAIVGTMPASKYDFAPKQGAFAHARTFGVQARHIAFCLNEVATALLGEPMLPHPDQEGPRDLTNPDQIVQYLKDAFAHAHSYPLSAISYQPSAFSSQLQAAMC